MKKVTTKYFIYILSFIVLSLSQSFPQVDTVRFAVIGDHGSQKTPSQTVANMVNSWPGVDFVLTLGENTTTPPTYGSIDSVIIDNDIGKYFHQWIKPYTGAYGSGSPDINRFFPTMGNHQYYYPPYGVGLQTYLDYFDSVLTRYSTSSGNIRYYNVRWSDDVELFILNNYDGWRDDTYDHGESEPDGWTIGSVQEQWLQTQMAASTARWKIVTIHHPPYTSQNWGLGGDWPEARWDFKGMGADAVLSAHYGIYERLIIDDLLYINNGVGGYKLSGWSSPEPGSIIRLAEYGAMLVEINGGDIIFKFYNMAGELRDSSSIHKEVNLSVKAFLQGSYSNGVMGTALNSQGLLPLSHPYNSTPWNYSGSESVAPGFFASHTDIVDWVLVELRKGTSSGTKVATRAAFLKSDGTIVDLGGSSPVLFSGLSDGNYYIVIRHRNHLAIMSANAVSLSGSSSLYDFTTAQNKAYTSGPNPMSDFGDGKFGMISGDGNANRSVTASDNNSVWLPQFLAGQDGYKSGDYNLNGSVTAFDNNSEWLVNNGKDSQVPD